MKRFRFVLFVVVAVALVTVPGLITLAAARPMGHGLDFVPRLERQIEALDITDETRAAIDGILDETAAKQDALHRKLRDAHRQMRALLNKQEVDEVAVLAQADVIGGLHTERRKNGLRAVLEVQALLTPEKREVLREAMRPGRDRRPCVMR